MDERCRVPSSHRYSSSPSDSSTFTQSGTKEDQYALDHNLLHLAITPPRKTLPITLVAIFISIAQRLGIDAEAIDISGNVHAFVPISHGSASHTTSYNPSTGGIHLDLSTTDSPTMSPLAIHNLLEKSGLPGDDRERLHPAETPDLMTTVAINMINSIGRYPAIHDVEKASYAALVVSIWHRNLRVIPAGLIDRLVELIYKDFRLDLKPVIQRLLLPALPTYFQGDLGRSLKRAADLVVDDHADDVRRNPSVKHFVGLIFCHGQHG